MRARWALLGVLLGGGSLTLMACSGDAPSAPAADDLSAPDPNAAKPPAPPRVVHVSASRFAARHVLVAYSGARGAGPEVTRTREDARTRAEEVLRLLRNGADFGRVAGRYSDDASRSFGGALGGFDRGTMLPEFEVALDELEPGTVRPTLLETPFGFHVLERQVLAEIRAQALTVSYAGAERAPAGVTRAREDARMLADAAHARLLAGEPWDKVVAESSDGAMKHDGGDLGWFTRGQLMPLLDEVAFDLDVGATSAVIETNRGFTILRRAD